MLLFFFFIVPGRSHAFVLSLSLSLSLALFVILSLSLSLSLSRFHSYARLFSSLLAHTQDDNVPFTIINIPYTCYNNINYF